MDDPLDTVAPAFVEMAHRIVWATAATVDGRGRPVTRILHPIWEWDGVAVRGWILTSPLSVKAKHLDSTPEMSLTYWFPNQDTCTARCATEWEQSPEQRAAGWRRFAEGPAPVGYDPAIIPGWDDPQSPGFGVLRVEPTALRVMDGSLMAGSPDGSSPGRLLHWRTSTA